jgi:hypothetical protein
MKQHLDSGGLDRDVKSVNAHHRVFSVAADLGTLALGMSPRLWVSDVIWKWDRDTLEVYETPCRSEVRKSLRRGSPLNDEEANESAEDKDDNEGDNTGKEHILPASMTSLCKYTRLSDVGDVPQTEVEWVSHVRPPVSRADNRSRAPTAFFSVAPPALTHPHATEQPDQFAHESRPGEDWSPRRARTGAGQELLRPLSRGR